MNEHKPNSFDFFRPDHDPPKLEYPSESTQEADQADLDRWRDDGGYMPPDDD